MTHLSFVPQPKDPAQFSKKSDSIRLFEKLKPNPSLAVVLSPHNNESVIGSLILLSKEYAGHVIVADQGSSDRTIEISRCAGAIIAECEIPCSRPRAIRIGCQVAIEQGCSAIVLIDCSGKNFTDEIPRLADPVLKGSADLVIGSRNLTSRNGISSYNLERESNAGIVSKQPTTFQCTDPNSPLRAFNTQAVKFLDLLPDNELFESAMISLFASRHLSIQEISLGWRDRKPLRNNENLLRYRGRTVAVVIPAHNEELLIGETLAGIPDFVARVYVVNDCSTDRTQDIINYYASIDKSIIPLNHSVNRGVGAAIITGYKTALEDGMDIVAVMAGDNQMDPTFLPALLDPIVDGKCDYTMGNRLISPAYRKGMSTWRFIGNAILTILTKVASGYWQMMDPQNGYTAISKRALERISLNEVYPRYGYCNDLLVRLNVNAFRVVNVPHPARYGREKSGIKYSSYIMNVSWLLLRDFLWRLKMKYIVLSFHPLVFFYLAGAVFTLIGIAGGFYSLYFKFVMGNPIFVPLTLSLLIFGFGLQALFFAMFYDMQQEKGASGWY